jgi:hypothetical protein
MPLGRKDQEWLMQTTRHSYALPGWKLGLFTPLVAVIGYLGVAFVLIFPIKLPRREKSQPAVS